MKFTTSTFTFVFVTIIGGQLSSMRYFRLEILTGIMIFSVFSVFSNVNVQRGCQTTRSLFGRNCDRKNYEGKAKSKIS